MPVRTTDTGRREWRPITLQQRALRLAGWFALLLGVLWAWGVVTANVDWPRLAGNVGPRLQDLGGRMFPPEWRHHDMLWLPLWQTINIATLGTLMAVAMAVPVAFLAARNTTPVWPVRQAALLVIVLSRSVNSLVWAIVFVAIVGNGMLAGVLAIACRSVGFVGKLFYEAIEEIDAVPVEAMRATGASGLQVLAWGVLPQVKPALWGIAILRWDVNIRESTIIGIVGAGGIGLSLNAARSMLQWDRVTLILLMILALVVLGEWLAAVLRKRLT